MLVVVHKKGLINLLATLVAQKYLSSAAILFQEVGIPNRSV